MKPAQPRESAISQQMSRPTLPSHAAVLAIKRALQPVNPKRG